MGMEKPRSDTDSNLETSSQQRVAIPNELGWPRILVNLTNDNCHNSNITLIKVVQTDRHCLLTAYQVYTTHGPCVECGPLELSVRPVTTLGILKKNLHHKHVQKQATFFTVDRLEGIMETYTSCRRQNTTSLLPKREEISLDFKFGHPVMFQASN
jgi:hypothetical protein